VKAAIARGHVIVAAVGNDGPATPVEYPAAYDGVIAVTSVDRARRIQIDANQGAQVAFAALGVDVPVAAPKKSYARVTGTSFAAPVVAAWFALKMSRPDPAAARAAYDELQHAAVDLGDPGRDSVFGWGFLESPNQRRESALAN
jgi:subtilisin family serine protease